MPITYDSGTNTITVVGGSESDPYTFEDIYQASQNNGWSIVDKIEDYTYIFKAKLQIGDGSTWTYFKDTLKVVIFTSDVELDYHDAIFDILRHAYFWLGEVDEDARVGHSGCIIITRDVVFNSYAFIIHNRAEGEIKLGGTVIYSEPEYELQHNLWLEDDSINKIYCCRVIGGASGIRMTKYLDVNEIVVQNAARGWNYGTTTEWTISNVTVEYCSTGLFAYDGYSVTFSNSRFAKSYYTIGTGDLATTVRLNDCWADEWRIQWSGSPTENAKIERAYTFKVKIMDKDGNPIQNALVELYDKNNNLVFAELTDSNGETSEHSIVSITYTPTETIDNNPYTVKITKDGYTPLEVQITIDKTMKNLVWQLDALDYTLDEIMQELQNHRNAVEPNIDAKISSRSSHSPADVWNYSNRELTNPDNYKADVSDLAKENTVQEIKAKTDKLQFNTDNDVKATLDGEKVNLTDTTESQIDNIETNVTNVDQYKADVSNLAKESTLQEVKDKTDKLNFDENDFVKSTAQNPELQNLDEKVSTRASESTVQSIKTKTDKLQFNAENDVKATLDGERVSLDADTENLIRIILGLVQHNYRLFNTTYTTINGRKKLTSATVKIYNTKEDCDNDNNPIKTYTLEIQYDNDGYVTDYKSKEV